MLALEWVFELLLANALQKMKDKHKFQNYFQMITDLDCPIHSVWNSLKKYHSQKIKFWGHNFSNFRHEIKFKYLKKVAM